ncbi:MAG: lipopolysaccharide assembly protein LapA domain-containing protein [Magnetospirillum sp.]
MRWLGWLIATPVALLIVVFAVANRHDVRLEFWPLPWAVDLPVYLVVLGVLAKGLVLGAVVTWLSGHKTRRRAREQRRRAESLERQLRAAESAAAIPALPVVAAETDRAAH